jgi:hypothetical protein
MEKIHYQVLLSGDGKSNFKTLVMFYTEGRPSTFAGKLNTAWTLYVLRKARMLKFLAFFSIHSVNNTTF